VARRCEVDIDLDTAPREVSVPADFAAALDAEPAARRIFDGLSYSNKSWHVLQVEGAKAEETRQRRIARSVDILKQGRTRQPVRCVLGKAPSLAKLAALPRQRP